MSKPVITSLMEKKLGINFRRPIDPTGVAGALKRIWRLLIYCHLSMKSIPSTSQPGALYLPSLILKQQGFENIVILPKRFFSSKNSHDGQSPSYDYLCNDTGLLSKYMA